MAGKKRPRTASNMQSNNVELSSIIEQVAEEEQDAVEFNMDQIDFRDYGPQDQTKQFENEKFRFMPSSAKVGAVAINRKAGISRQYIPPITAPVDGTTWRPLQNVHWETKFGVEHLRAETPTGKTQMLARRKFSMNITDADGDISELEFHRFSPYPRNAFWGMKEENAPVWREGLDDEVKEDLDLEMQDVTLQKKHMQWVIDPGSVVYRDSLKTRRPDQNTVMGRSAFEEAQSYLETYKSELHPERIQVLEANKAAKAHWRGGSRLSQGRFEWLHGKGFGLTLKSEDPQKKSNLAAAPKWLNSLMMVIERAAKWVALHHQHAKVNGSFWYKMVPGTEIMDSGNLTFVFEENGKKIEVSQDLIPWQKWPIYPKPTDIMQATYAIVSELKNKSVDSGVIIELPMNMELKGGLMSRSNIVKEKVAEESEEEVVIDDYNISESSPEQISVPKTMPLPPESIIRVESCIKFYNPWKPIMPPEYINGTGSGFVIENRGELYIVTNYHVVENAMNMMVRLSNDRRSYQAELYAMCPQNDMALLRVKSKEFKELAKPVQLGSMPHVQDNVTVVGYPIGGEHLSITEGPVSRITVATYEQSQVDGLQIQVQAPINAGNSGGPVVRNGKVVGIAFQTHAGEHVQGTHYVIPPPIIKQFFKDAFDNPPGPDKKVKGAPTISCDLEPLDSAVKKRHHGIPESYNGVKVNSVDPLSSAYGILKENDIIISINGYKLNIDGLLNIPGIGEDLDLNVPWSLQQVGDVTTLEVLRRRDLDKKLIKKQLEITLKERPGQTKILGEYEYGEAPEYYVYAGYLFTTGNLNFFVHADEMGRSAKASSLQSIIDGKNRMAEMPATRPGQRFIVMSRLFQTRHNHVVDVHDAVVKFINGQEIWSINDAINAIESCKTDTIEIELWGNKEKVVIEKCDNSKFLENAEIPFDRSLALRNRGQQTKPAVTFSNKKRVRVETPASESEPESEEYENYVSSDEDEEQPPSNQLQENDRAIIAGVAKEMEERYKAGEFDNEDDEEVIFKKNGEIVIRKRNNQEETSSGGEDELPVEKHKETKKQRRIVESELPKTHHKPKMRA